MLAVGESSKKASPTKPNLNIITGKEALCKRVVGENFSKPEVVFKALLNPHRGCF